MLVDACPVFPGAESLGFELHGIIWGEDSHICRSWLLLLRSRAEKAAAGLAAVLVISGDGYGNGAQ